jgi:hypothetical protein
MAKATTVNKKVSATQNDINCNWKATSYERLRRITTNRRPPRIDTHAVPRNDQYPTFSEAQQTAKRAVTKDSSTASKMHTQHIVHNILTIQLFTYHHQ